MSLVIEKAERPTEEIHILIQQLEEELSPHYALYPGFAEVKRMFVSHAARGQGIADAIMDRLAAVAREAGRPLLRLETGDRQQAAIRFYQRYGFGFCGPFAPYSTMPPKNIATSIFMEKSLI